MIIIIRLDDGGLGCDHHVRSSLDLHDYITETMCCAKPTQRLRRWSNIVQMLYKCFVFAGKSICITFVQCRPNVLQMFSVCWEKAVNASLRSKQLLPFVFARQRCWSGSGLRNKSPLDPCVLGRDGLDGVQEPGSAPGGCLPIQNSICIHLHRTEKTHGGDTRGYLIGLDAFLANQQPVFCRKSQRTRRLPVNKDPRVVACGPSRRPQGQNRAWSSVRPPDGWATS